MMVGIDQARHDDRVAGVDDFGVVGLDVDADANDAIALDEHITGFEVRGIGIHRHDGSPFEEGAGCALRAHVQVLPDVVGAGFGCEPVIVVLRC
jgi:hypothetical protein